MEVTATDIELDSMTYDSGSDTYRFTFDPTEVSPSMAVVSALSSALDVAPTDLDPIHDHVDTDALDALVRVRRGGVGDVTISLTEAAYTLTVHSYGLITIVPAKGDETTDWAECPGDE